MLLRPVIMLEPALVGTGDAWCPTTTVWKLGLTTVTTPVWKLILPLTKIAPVTSIALMVAAKKTILYRMPVGSVAILAHALGLGMYDAEVALMVIAGYALLIA